MQHALRIAVRSSIIVVATLAFAGCAARSSSSLTPAASNAAGAPLGVHRASSNPVTIDASAVGATIDLDALGANMPVWYDITQSGLSKEFTTAGMHLVRWPGGSDADEYHWQTNTLCNGGYADPNSTFDNFMQDVVKPAHLDVAITLNYGSNEACNAGGDPTEGAGWVDYANNTKHYGVKYWTVGNEVYGSWEYDLHNPPHDAATYANAVATGFYPAIKAKDHNAQVGVVAIPNWNPNWDSIVLKQAKFDFVELHYYAQTPGQENDAYLVQQAPAAFATFYGQLQSDMNAAGVPNSVPIYVGELGSVYSNPGKQTTSITQALFAGQIVADIMQFGSSRATWWIGNGGCSDASSGNFSNSLYGWQTFGGYMIFSDGLPEYGCPNAPQLARGVLLPTARAYQVVAAFAHGGQKMLGANVPQSLPNVRAYGATTAKGYTALLFNVDQNDAATFSLEFLNAAKSSYKASQKIYSKAIYDASKQGKWKPPVTKSLGTVGTTLTVTLPPWSISAVTLN